MSTPILATKLFIPPPRPKTVSRLRLIERLNEWSRSKLTLISAPAGSGKTTLVSEWIAGFKKLEPQVPVAWLSLDQGDNDPARFLTYFIAALRTISENFGAGLLGMIQSPQPPPAASILTALLNEIAAVPDDFVLVLDDYHVIEAKPVDDALIFLIEHLPKQMHLLIATREDPQLLLPRLRARGQLTELRAADLRFTPAEAIDFFNQVMGLNLSKQDIIALETRTEGWIAGMQLAALALQGPGEQGQQDTAGFIQSFTGSHHFVLDYLLEEVLKQQTDAIQTFLLKTSILERMCGPLCDAVLLNSADSAQATLEYLERANLFIVPLDNERRWYRYHHLFADFLQQRLRQSIALSPGNKEKGVAELHIHASQWYEDNGLELEAFHHAATANDIERAARLLEGKGMPLQFRGAVVPVLNWLESLPASVLDAKPSLWVMYASALSMTGQMTGVEQKLQSAESALRDAVLDDKIRNLIGHIAAIRALLAAAQNQVDAIITQSQRALEYLHPDNLPVRTATIWKLGIAYQLQGNRAAARQAYSEAVTISQATGNIIINVSATAGLASILETNNQLYPAFEAYRRILQMLGDFPQPSAFDAHLGLARIYYEWNDLANADIHGQQSLQMARPYEKIVDRLIISELFLARLKLAQGDGAGADAILAEADQSMRLNNFMHRMPEMVSVQVLALLQKGGLAAADQLAQAYDLPLSQARVQLAQGDPAAALAALAQYRQQMEAKNWQDERLKAMVLQAVALNAHGEKAMARHVLAETLKLAEPGGFIRLFLDEGAPMAELLSEVAAQGVMPDYTGKLLAALKIVAQKSAPLTNPINTQPLIEPLSPRELEVLRLIATGLSNHEIAERLFLALNTVKGHNQIIFDKLQVQSRTEAAARARELGLL